MKTQNNFNQKGSLFTNTFKKLSLLFSIFLIVGFSHDLFANAKQFKFTNNTGQHANDLHIEFNKQVDFPANPNDPGTPPQDPPGTFKEASGAGTSTVNLAQGVTGNGVANGGSVVLTFSFQGTPPKVKKAFWTKKNTLTPGKNDRLGKYLIFNTAWIRFEEQPATGNGVVEVTIDGQQYLFETLAGETGSAASQRFAQFIESIPFGVVYQHVSSSVHFSGLAISDHSNINVEVLVPDVSQDIQTVIMYQPMPVNYLFSNVLSGTSAELHWEPDPMAIGYRIKLEILGSATASYINVSGPVSNYQLNNLMPGTTYIWRIDKYYSQFGGIINSGFSDPDTFTTPGIALCATPDTLFTHPVKKTAARLNWSPVAGAYGYQIRGGIVGTSGAVTLFVPGGNTNHLDVYGLQPMTSYWWQIRTVCGGGPNFGNYYFSPWSPIDTFTTYPLDTISITPRLANQNIEDNKDKYAVPMAVYPNPASDRVTIDIPGEIGMRAKIKIVDINGRTVDEFEGNAGQNHLQVADYQPGIYQIIIDGVPAGRNVIKLSVLR